MVEGFGLEGRVRLSGFRGGYGFRVQGRLWVYSSGFRA